MRRAILILVALAIALPSAALSSDYRTNYRTWLPNSNDFGSGWDGALANGALVWDHVTNQCHNFQRLVSGNNNPDIWVWKDNLDGKGGIYGFTVLRPGSGPQEITLDVMETWHLNVNVSPGGSSLDAWSVFAHEMGHTLHLDGYTANPPPGPTMTEPMGDYYGKTWARSLETYDMQHERALYPVGSC